MIEIEFNADEITAALARAVSVLGDTTELMGDIGEMLVASTQDRMLRGEQPDGEPFAPRAPATLDRYAREVANEGGRYGPRPLDKTGMMRQTLHHQAGADHVRIGSNAIQAAVMQFGAEKGAFGKTGRGLPIPWGDIPARPFLGISEADRDAILAEIEDALRAALGDHS